MDCGGCCHSHWRVRLANLGRWPHCSALASVDMAGLKRVVWAKVTKLAGVVLPVVALARCIGCAAGWMFSSHSLVAVVCCPSRIRVLLW